LRNPVFSARPRISLAFMVLNSCKGKEKNKNRVRLQALKLQAGWARP